MAFPQASDYRPPIIPDGEEYDNPDNGKSYYWTQILLPEGSTVEMATTIGGYWTVVCDEDEDYNLEIEQLQYEQQLLQNAVDQIYLDQQTGVSARSPIFSDTEPTVHPDFTAPNNALVAGDIWYDITDLEQLIEYVYDGTQWILTGNYVKKKGGDTMEGPLVVTGPRSVTDGLEGTVKALNIDSGQNGSLNLKHNGNTRIYVGDTQTSFIGDIKFNNSGSAIYAGSDKKAFTINDDGAFYEGNYTVDKHVATKKNLDDVNEALYQDIIELKEEINAIAPSLEYGSWEYVQPQTAGRPPTPGTFHLLNNLAFTDKYDETTAILIHNDEFIADVDDEVDNHTWADANIDDLIQLFDAADPDFFLGKITGKDVDVANQYVIFTVNRIQSSGVPNDKIDPVTGVYLTRVNIFKEPSGGIASDFVLKTGDTMSGALIIDKTAGGSIPADGTEASLGLIGSRPDTTKSAATIKFENKQTTEPGFLTYRSGSGGNWFAFTQDVDLNNKGLHTVAQIRLNSGGYIGSGTSPRVKVKAGGNGDGLAGTEIQRPGDNKRTFAIRGKAAAENSSVTDIFWAFGNATGGDAINYTGKITANDHIINKKYVDDKFVKGNYTITKSNGNYYISE